MNIMIQDVLDRATGRNLITENGYKVYKKYLAVDEVLKDRNCIVFTHDERFIICFPETFFQFEGQTLEITFDITRSEHTRVALVKRTKVKEDYPETIEIIERHDYAITDIEFADKERFCLHRKCVNWLDSALNFNDIYTY